MTGFTVAAEPNTCDTFSWIQIVDNDLGAVEHISHINPFPAAPTFLWTDAERAGRRWAAHPISHNACT